jgi:UDP-N-acetylmuramyl pentapeptide phosphotransferase/UDP-N-acetylglucosamine-1-phosphate transferase
MIIRYQHLHVHFTADPTIGAQKFHELATPRVGGVAVFVSLICVWFLRSFSQPILDDLPIFLICVPVFFLGLLEDVTKKIGVKLRLAGAFFSGLLAFMHLNAHIVSIDIPFLDQCLSIMWVSAIFSAFAIAGLSNAYNIIDGFNGLASMVGMIALSSIAYIAWTIGDSMIIFNAVAMVTVLLGFFIWNYPRGLIFLGDAGAYLIGSWIAILSIQLVFHHHEVSPWFALLVNAYPITETLFTIIRRLIKDQNPGLPDAYHLHTLIYKRIVSWATPYDTEVINKTSKNASTSGYLWLLSSIGAVPALIFWDSSKALMVCSLLYCLIYILAYKLANDFEKGVDSLKDGE